MLLCRTTKENVRRSSFTAVPWTADGVDCGDVHVVHECQSRRSDAGEGRSERVSGDEQLPVLPLLLVELFDSCVHTPVAVPYSV